MDAPLSVRSRTDRLRCLVEIDRYQGVVYVNLPAFGFQKSAIRLALTWHTKIANRKIRNPWVIQRREQTTKQT